MRKIKWGDLLLFFCVLYTLIFLFGFDRYDYFIKNPTEHGSGTTSSRLFYFLMFKMDEYIGRTGLFIFFVFWGLIFLSDFYRDNMAAIKNRYRDWKETGDWRKLFGK